MLGGGAGHLDQRRFDSLGDLGLLLVGPALEPVDVDERHRSGSRALGERRLELGLEAPLRHRSDDFLHDRPVLEEEQGRDREDFVLGRGLLVLIDVEADDRQVVALGVDLLEDRMDDAAGAAPGGPEVDENGAIGLQNVGL